MNPHRHFACAVAALLAAVCAAPITWAQPQNLLPNGSFETGTFTGWGGASGATITTNEAHAGRLAAQLGSQTLTATVNLPAGEPAKLTGWIRITSTVGNDHGWGGFRFEALSYDWKTLSHSGWLLQRTHGTNWFKVALRFVPTTSQTRLQIGYFGDAARQMTVLLDDVMVFPKPATNAAPVLQATLTPTLLSALPTAQAFQVVATDPDGAIQRVLWDFGDGVRATVASGNHVVGVPGQYRARVTVSDDDGAVSTQTIPWSATDPGFPTLEVAEPAEETSTNAAAAVRFAGSAAGANVVVRVTSDREVLAAVSGSTNWVADVSLKPGWNRVLIQAQDAQGRVVTQERRVRYVPGGPLGILAPELSHGPAERWDTLAITFALTNSAATHPEFPFDPQPAPGLEWVDGVSVDAVFTPDQWRTVYRRPAFLHQAYLRALKGGEEWLYPTNDPGWTVRFAPPQLGTWRYRIEVTEARGQARSSEGTLTVIAPTSASNRGPIRVANTDTRYFEYADGTTFLGGGHNIGFSAEKYSYDAEDQFAAMGEGNQQFFRWWIAGNLWGSAWQPWNSRTLGYNGTVPKTGLSLESAYADGVAAVRLDAANPIVFQGWMSGHAGLLRGRTYVVRVRWRTYGVTGPATAGQPFGLCAKLTGWPEPGQTGALPILVPHAMGDTPWHVATGAFTATTDLLPNLSLILENTTGGAGFVDEVGLHEVLPDARLGPQLLRSACFNSHLHFDARRGAGLDAILAAAERRNAAFKLNVSEKQEELLNWLGPDGLPDPLGGHFNGGPGTPSHRLHEYYWRHLLARLGASRAIHSWELVNEEDPNNLPHFRLAADLARLAAADGNPHPSTTSTWAGFASNSWTAAESAPLAYADFHAYVRSTGELTPKEELANDSARFFHDYDLAARSQGFGKPVVWGEMGIDGSSGSDGQDPLLAQDTAGVWLHKIVWARTGPGGVYPLYWYTDHIRNRSLHSRFGSWNRFMAGIPLHNGRYVDAAATASHPDVRVWGQKDLLARRAHLWIDNRLHTWRAVVAGSNVPPASASITIDLGQPSASYNVTWVQTVDGAALTTEPLTADSAGRLLLNVSGLATDLAALIVPTPPVQISPRIDAFEVQPDAVRVGWVADPGRAYHVLVAEDAPLGPWAALPEEVIPAGIHAEFRHSTPAAAARFYRVELR